MARRLNLAKSVTVAELKRLGMSYLKRGCPHCGSKLILIRNVPGAERILGRHDTLSCPKCGFQRHIHDEPYKVNFRCENSVCCMHFANEEMIVPEGLYLKAYAPHRCPCCDSPVSG